MRGSAFGLDIVSSLLLPGPWRTPVAELPKVEIVAAARGELDAAWTGAERLGWQGLIDGRRFRVDHGQLGDLWMHLEPGLDMHLAADGATLRVADEGSDAVRTARVLIDSALFTVSLRLGNEALHAGAVAVPAGVIALPGPTGAGKSSLVAALLGAGCSFVTDDVLVIRSREGAILGAPGPPLITVRHPAPPGLGELIADLGEESWLGVETIPADLPLAGVVYLDPPGQAPETAPGLEWRDPLMHLLRFPRTRERELSRFELAAELASRVPVLRLTWRDGAPGQLARRVLDWAS